MSEGLYTPVQLGNYLLYKFRRIGFVKLQAVVYFAQGWHLALRDEPLVSETLEAWKYGPVYHSIYSKRDGLPSNLPIPSIEDADLSPIEDREIREYLEAVYHRYEEYTPHALNCMTQAEGTPWFQVTQEYLDEDESEQLPRHLPIPTEMIKEHFQVLLEKNRKPKSKARYS